MVALTILASTIALTLAATQTARRAATAALETRQADALLQYELLAAPHDLGAQSGQAAGFAWRLDTAVSAISAGAAAPPMCLRRAQARSLRSGRRYRLATSEICPQTAQSGAAS